MVFVGTIANGIHSHLPTNTLIADKLLLPVNKIHDPGNDLHNGLTKVTVGVVLDCMRRNA